MIADQHMPIVCRAIVKGKQTAGSSLELIATHGYTLIFMLITCGAATTRSRMRKMHPGKTET